MTPPLLPRLVEPFELQARLGEVRLLIVDMSRRETYLESHIPGAVNLDYAALVRAEPPAQGLLPDESRLSELFSALGLRPDSHVVAYDEEGGSRATRLVWTLDVLRHPTASLLNGGLLAWEHEGRPLESGERVPRRSDYRATIEPSLLADKEWILAHLHDPEIVLLDTRSPAEHQGTVLRAARGGHIPGAVNFDYVNAMDRARDLRLRDEHALRRELSDLGVTPDKEVVVYCQTHHRSSHTYFVLKHLGFPRVRAYPGSWSEWGNLPDTPIE